LLALADKIAIRAALSAVHEVMLIAQSILIIFFDPNFFSSGVFGPTLLRLAELVDHGLDRGAITGIQVRCRR
jgi:hypothetical protein